MPIPERKLEIWTHQGAISTAKLTHESIREALNSCGCPDGIQFEIYLQGSYKNTTNIRGNSDVDVVLQLNTSFLNNLSEDLKKAFGFVRANYTWHDFHSDVLNALRQHYGSSNVTVGRKSLKVQTQYLPADVVVSLQYRKYPEYPESVNDFVEGIAFWADPRWIVNYPKLHWENGVAKNKRTRGLYKRIVRMFKNARSHLETIERIPKDLAPSYFLECFVYNVPEERFVGSLQEVYVNVLDHWVTAISNNYESLLCQNEQLPLFGEAPEQWSVDKAVELIRALTELWKTWG